MRADLSRLTRVAAALALVVLGTGTSAHAVDPEGETTVEVSTAVLRWGMSNEANNAAHAPGTYNFFSAGRIRDPGKGNVALPQSAWRQSAEKVAIEKWNGSAYRPATWAGLRTDADGVTISGPTSGRYSGHQFVFSSGTGTVDREAGTAHLEWTGDVSVLFYSGFTFFYLSDPVLEVADGHGLLTGTLSGFGSSREQPEEWNEIPAREVTLADLPSIDLDDVAGFNATPAYDGVTVAASGTSWTGAFPQSFVSFMDELGAAPFWLNSGGSTDPAKKALPLSVSYDASDPVTPTTPEPPTPTAPIDNDAPPPPRTITKTVVRTRTVTAAPAPVAAPPVAPAAPAVAPATTSEIVTLVAQRTATQNETSRLWWVGGLLLALAALVAAGALRAPLRSHDEPSSETSPPERNNP